MIILLSIQGPPWPGLNLNPTLSLTQIFTEYPFSTEDELSTIGRFPLPSLLSQSICSPGSVKLCLFYEVL